MSIPPNDPTELVNPELSELDLMSTSAVLDVLWDSQQRAIHAVSAVKAELQKAIDVTAERLRTGNGRLIMVGAGASGRLAVQDGAELWPTYGWPHDRLLLQMAGGEPALLASVEGVEDDIDDAASAVIQHAVGQQDVVLALAASGRSPWTCTWLHNAGECGALTIGMANNPDTPLLQIAQHSVLLASGEEVLAGSTRMAAGTAQKVALNLFSTGVMVRLNRTYGNLMVDMAAVNTKLDARRLRMLSHICPTLDDSQADQALQQAGGWVKLAAVLACGVDQDRARKLLADHDGNLRSVMNLLANGSN